MPYIATTSREQAMDYIKIRFGDEFNEFQSKFDRSIEDAFRSLNPIFSLGERTWRPPVDIYETSEEIIMRAEIAGADTESLEVAISSKAVKISGTRRELPRIDNATYRLAEIQYGYFERILYLPVPIDTEVVTSSYADGFLEIRLAKQPSEKTFKVPISDDL
jgi:HSP20 family protein